MEDNNDIDELFDETAVAVDDKAEYLGYLSKEADEKKVANETIQNFINKNICTHGFRRLQICGGDYSSVNVIDVINIFAGIVRLRLV